MRVRLPYGKNEVAVEFREDLDVRVVEARAAAGLPDEAGAVREALQQPIGAAALGEQVRSTDAVGIVVNDITRPTPYKILLPELLAELRHVPDEQIVILVATGTHRPNTPAELQTMLGAEIVERFRIVQNDASDAEAHALAGVTRAGQEARLHKAYLGCDFRILTGFIEPHFFAGYSGGGKACMPGMASMATILRNHRAENIDHPKATWSVTEGNPIWEEIREVALMVGPTFLLNVALNTEGRITGVFAGDLVEAHRQGCAFVMEHATVSVDGRFDIVISSSSGAPLDLNLYQAVKGMSVAAEIVKEGGAIIVAADCWDGIPEHGEYKQLLFESSSPDALLGAIRSGPADVPDTWQAQIHAQVCRHANVYLYSDNLTDEQIERAMLKPCRDIGRAVDQLVQAYGPDASICVLPAGPQAVPCVRSTA